MTLLKSIVPSRRSYDSQPSCQVGTRWCCHPFPRFQARCHAENQSINSDSLWQAVICCKESQISSNASKDWNTDTLWDVGLSATGGYWSGEKSKEEARNTQHYRSQRTSSSRRHLQSPVGCSLPLIYTFPCLWPHGKC